MTRDIREEMKARSLRFRPIVRHTRSQPEAPSPRGRFASNNPMSILNDFNLALAALIADSDAKDATIADLRKQLAALQPSTYRWENLQVVQGWKAPANVGDTGGGNAQVAGTGSLTLGTLTSPLQYRFKPGHPFNNAYVYLELERLVLAGGAIITPGQLASLSTFRYSLDLSLPVETSVWQAIEFELQYAHAGWIYNMAWQILPTGVLRAFQYITKQWVDTGLRCNVAELNAGQVMRIAAEFRANQAMMSETHTRITIDGTAMPVEFSQPAQSGTGEYLHCAFQLDTDAAMHPYMLAVGNIIVEAG